MEKVNLQVLSDAVGVSKSTVSRILNGKARKYRIATATIEKVMKKAAELNFRPNYFAHSLNTGKTFNIGLIFANRVDAFLGTILEGVEARLRDTEFQMVVATCENSLELEKIEAKRMFYRQVDGLIIYPSAVDINENYPTSHLLSAKHKNIPIVAIGREVKIKNADHILFADYQLGRYFAEKFLNSNCKKFAMINLPIKCSANYRRRQGFFNTLLENAVPEKNIVEVGNRKRSFADQLALLEDVDAVLAVNASLLLPYAKAMMSFRDLTDVKFATAGTEEFADFFPFVFEYKKMPAREMGFKAADLLLQRLEPAFADKDKKTIYLDWPE